MAASTFAAAWYHSDATQRAPDIPGWEWAQHPDTLLLSYPTDDCGCGASPTEYVQEGFSRGLDVLVITPSPFPKLAALKKAGFSPSRFSFVTNIDQNIIKRFSRNKDPMAARIKHGRIVALAGGADSSLLFEPKEVKR